MSRIDPILGYQRTRLSDRIANLQASYRAIFGADIDLEPDSPDGQVIGIFAEAADDLDQILENTYNQRSPSGATGAQLARLSLINGVKKLLPAHSTGTVTLAGTVGTAVPAGSLIRHDTDQTAIFATDIDATIGGGGTVDVSVTSQAVGPVQGPAGHLTKMLTVISGWTSVTNAADVTLGNLGESDPALRIRRAASVALPGQGMLDSLLAALLQVPDVIQAIVRENPEDTTQTLADGGTLVAHAIQAIIDGGDDTAIAKAMWLKRFPGCTMVGATSVAVTDSQGTIQTVKFDRPTPTAIYVAIHATPTPSSPVQIAIQNAIVAWSRGLLQRDGTVLQLGQSPTAPLYPPIKLGGGVPWAQIFAPINTVPGATGITAVDIGLTASPTLQADIPGVFNQLPTFDVGNITFV